MVKQSAYNGKVGESPFHFEHFNIISLGLYRDGQAVPFRQSYQPSWANREYTSDYFKSIIQNTQHLNTNLNNGIDMADWSSGGYCFFTFNLTADHDMNHTQSLKDDNLRLDMRFAKGLAATINVIVYAIFDTQIQITRDRKIIVDAY